MLNLILSNFRIEFSPHFFPEEITKKYTEFLFHKNYPIKKLDGYLLETIKDVSIPGIALEKLDVNSLPNLGKNSGFNGQGEFNHTTVNRIFPGTAAQNDIIDSKEITITFNNTILNWMYCYEVMYGYYKRRRDISDFSIYLIMCDSANIPMFRFNLSDCFIGTIPGLNFSYTDNMSDAKTFDCGFTFNKFDVEFMLPDFKKTNITL